MSKELEGFKIMVKDNDLELPYHNTIIAIENALKEKEKQDQILNIIKERRVDAGLLISLIERGDKTLSLGVLGTYNLEIDKAKHLTQEEFDLLKDWLK